MLDLFPHPETLQARVVETDRAHAAVLTTPRLGQGPV